MFFVIFVEGLSGRYLLNLLFNQIIIIFMKRFITILVFASLAFLANAQMRMRPVHEVDHRTYQEVVDIIFLMERTSAVERMEKIKLDDDLISTSGGEFLLQKDENTIKIMHQELMEALDDHVTNTRRRWYSIENIRTELILQNAKLYEYMLEELEGNRRIKNMYIKTDLRTVGTYIRIDFYKL